MESILDDIDAMIGELDDLNYSPNKKTESTKKDPNVLELTDNTKEGQGFADLINDLAAFDPTPVAKDKSLNRADNTSARNDEEMTNHKLIRGGSLRSKSEENNKTTLDRRKPGSLKETTTTQGRNRKVSETDRRKGSMTSENGTFERKRTLSRKGSELDNFTLLPSPSENIKISMSDGNLVKTVRVERSQTAWDTCLSLLLRNELRMSSNWCLVEQLTDISCERILEDHEIVVKVYKTWGQNGANNKLSLVENEKKWEFLEHPEMFFPTGLIDRIRGRSRDDVEEVLTQEYFGDKAPPIEGYLYFKDSKHSWSRKYFILRSSGLYYSTKGKSRAPQDLACFTTLQDISLYFCVDAKVDHKAPTEHALSFKNTASTTVSLKDMKCVAAESESDMMRWYHALRVVKYGDKIPENRAAVLLEVTQEIERLNEEKRQKAVAEEAASRALAKTSSSSLELGTPKKPPPPCPKPIVAPEPHKPRPMPSPKPSLKKMQLPVPPMKPKVNPPPPPQKHSALSQQSPPSPPKPVLHPAKPAVPTPAISKKPVSQPPAVPDEDYSFADAQAQLAKRLNGTINKKPTSPMKPIRPDVLSPAVFSKQADLPPPPPVDELPPPPADFLVEQPALVTPALVKTSAPVQQPPRSKISEMVKNLNTSQVVSPSRPCAAETTGMATRSVSELTSHLNKTLKKNQTSPSLINPVPPKPPMKPGSTKPVSAPMSATVPEQSAVLNRSQTCPQIAPSLIAPSQGPGSLVHKMSQELAGKLGGRPPIRTSESDTSPVHHTPPPLTQHRHNIPADHPPIPPPARFQTLPPQRHAQPIRAPPPNYPVAHYAAPADATHAGMVPGLPGKHAGTVPRLPGSVPPPPPGMAPSRGNPSPCPAPTPPLPSRKDSLVASRSRTISGSSGGSQLSHSSLQLHQMYPQQGNNPALPLQDAPVRPPPRVQSRDKLRSSFENLSTLGRPVGPPGAPPAPVSTASPGNTSAYRGIPNVFQRNTSPFLMKPPPGMGMSHPPPGMGMSHPPPGMGMSQPPPITPPHDSRVMSPTRWQEQTLMQDISSRDYPPVTARDYNNHGYQEVVSNPNSYPANHLIRHPHGSSIPANINHNIPVNINHIRAQQQRAGAPPQAAGPRGNLSHHQSEGNLFVQQRPMYNRGYSMGQLNGAQSVSTGSNNSEEVVYEYIQEEPHKVEHLQHWLANVGPYDDDALSIASGTFASDNIPGGAMITPPPRSESKRSPATSDPHCKQPWYHGAISRDNAYSTLTTHGKGDGLFLIRSSTSNAGDFVLSMTHGGQVKHFQVTQRGGRPPWYAIEDGPAFPDIIKLVQHYSSSADRLPCKLSSYCMHS